MSVLKVQYYSNDDEFTLPTIAYGDGAGYDLYSAETVTILPQSCEGVNCKFNMAIPRGYYAQVCSRSGLVKHHLITAEARVIDSGFRGELFVFLFNHGKELFIVKPEDKIAQMIFMKKETVEFVRFDDLFKLGKTERGDSGFGISGFKKRKHLDFEFTESQPFPDNDENSSNDELIIVEDAKMSGNGKIIVDEKVIINE